MRCLRRWSVLCSSVVAALLIAGPAGAYGWPVKPFDVPHAIRGNFGDPRYHLGSEEQLSEAFHFGVDIVGDDGEPVYAVERAVVVRRRATALTLETATGRRFGYWHVRPVVRSGTHVRLHQLVGYILPGWGHVHFAESVGGAYRNPLRKGALTPFLDTTAPTVASVTVLGPDGAPVAGDAVSGVVSVVADISDTPPLVPAPPWEITRLAPSFVSWTLFAGEGFPAESHVTADFDFDLPPNTLYGAIYAPGTYQNKPHRPGHYVFWIARELDTTTLPNGTYRLQVTAVDTHRNQGVGTVEFTVANP